MRQLSVHADDVDRLLERVRRTAPLVQCVTNTVVQNVTTNALLAIGASPAMVDVAEESGGFARAASSLLVNLGTATPEQRAAAREAVDAARDAGTPWVLDPVAAGALLPVRTALALDLATRGPAVIRGNASEIAVLAGAGSGGRGTDADRGVDEVLPAAAELARRTGAVVAVSGPVDAITDGERVARIPHGTPLLTRITGGGCALGAVVAAFAGAAPEDPLLAASSAVAAYTIAAERAAEGPAGPGSFQPRFLDELAAVDGSRLAVAIAREGVAA
ncbi:hydroxyethylthiazole kinase [Microbacterium indicum]|uniref:hydroxyethylthiazole kinase n=1 Tax=Microbacterium indicum TaxID=358100 RepID=UPI00040E95FD|nr:hydroxyethylthiazole kinase [Microbacterium indicum]